MSHLVRPSLAQQLSIHQAHSSQGVEDLCFDQGDPRPALACPAVIHFNSPCVRCKTFDEDGLSVVTLLKNTDYSNCFSTYTLYRYPDTN